MLAIAHQTLGAIPTNVDCDLSSSTNIELKWHPYASEWGLYSVKGDAGTANEIECEGASPKLHLNQGQKYTFVQNDVSNWYHPVGFSYEPGGAHNDCRIDNSGECPELDGSHLQYKVDGKNAEDGDFGLDAYEPLFFFPQEEWVGDTHTYSVCLLYTSPSPRDGLLSRMPSSA